MVEFARPELILILPLLVFLIVFSHFFSQKLKRSLEVFHFPPVGRLVRIAARKTSRSLWWRGVNLGLKVAIVVLFTVALASPSAVTFEERVEKTTVPIVQEEDLASGVALVMDVSASMGIRDIQPSRFEAARASLRQFITNSSEEVRFGLVAFDDQLKASAPLGKDKDKIIGELNKLHVSEALPCLEEYTDIGVGVQTALNFLSPYVNASAEAQPTSAVILISDGFANRGYPSPITSALNAARRADEMNIPIHVVHVAMLAQDSNPSLLRQIAETSGGTYAEVGDLNRLSDALDTLSKYYTPTHTWNVELEVKTTIPTTQTYGPLLILVATILLGSLWVGNYRFYKTTF